MIKGWEEAYISKYKEKANVVEFVILEKWLHQKLEPFYRSVAKRMSLPSVRIFHSLPSEPSSLRTAFSIRNTSVNSPFMNSNRYLDFWHDLWRIFRYVGYSYLVDSQRNIRWKAAGTAEPHELDQLFKIADSLLVPSLK